MTSVPRRLAFVLCLAGWLGGCGYGQVVSSWFDQPAATEPLAGQKLPGHVYLLRGLTSVYSYGMDQLTDKIARRGVSATVYGLTETESLPEEIIGKYKSGEDRGPIMLIGHSSGADRIVTIAQKLQQADVPVALAFGFDPTRIIGDVPANVELFINLYQRFNPIGGGQVGFAPGFRGRLINVDLHEHTEIVHITLDKTPAIHDVVVEKIIAVAAHAARPAKFGRGKLPESSAGLRPLQLKYAVPRDAPIVLWDDAVKVKVKSGETLEAVASAYAVPTWAIAQINEIAADGPLEPGRVLIVPRSLSADVPPPAVPVATRAPSRRVDRLATKPASPRLPQEEPAADGPAVASPPGGNANSFSDRWRPETVQ